MFIHMKRNIYIIIHIDIKIIMHMYCTERGAPKHPVLNHAQGLGYRNLRELDLTRHYMPMRQLKVGVDMIPSNANCNLHIPQRCVGWNSIIGSWSFKVDQTDHSLQLKGRLQVSFSFCCSIELDLYNFNKLNKIDFAKDLS